MEKIHEFIDFIDNLRTKEEVLGFLKYYDENNAEDLLKMAANYSQNIQQFTIVNPGMVGQTEDRALVDLIKIFDKHNPDFVKVQKERVIMKELYYEFLQDDEIEDLLQDYWLMTARQVSNGIVDEDEKLDYYVKQVFNPLISNLNKINEVSYSQIYLLVHVLLTALYFYDLTEYGFNYYRNCFSILLDYMSNVKDMSISKDDKLMFLNMVSVHVDEAYLLIKQGRFYSQWKSEDKLSLRNKFLETIFYLRLYRNDI
jgi:hypothetical protein